MQMLRGELIIILHLCLKCAINSSTGGVTPLLVGVKNTPGKTPSTFNLGKSTSRENRSS